MSYLNKSLDNSKLPLKNRLVFPPMATSKSNEDGKVSKELIDYYDEKSQGGYISLLIIEHSFVTPQGKASKGQLSVADDSAGEGLKKLAQTIYKNGSKAVMQINHAGSGTSEDITGQVIVGPSAVTHPKTQNVPSVLSIEEIKQIVNHFKDAAKRVKEAGFDGVEIHSAHGYLLNEFYSPITNKRTDEYGGDIYNRIKIHLEVIAAIKETVGNDFPILLRLGAADYMENGSTVEDAKVAAIEFQKAGVDILDISGGLCGFAVPGLEGQGYFSELTQPIKEVVSIPVILTGGITDAQAAEDLLLSGKADLVGVGRAIFKDSTWAKNAMETKTVN
jgi:2,4-dienoyl-CoA reductase-like NADH-dependent reductase (Old Yellow Enzyme family)